MLEWVGGIGNGAVDDVGVIDIDVSQAGLPERVSSCNHAANRTRNPFEASVGQSMYPDIWLTEGRDSRPVHLRQGSAGVQTIVRTTAVSRLLVLSWLDRVT